MNPDIQPAFLSKSRLISLVVLFALSIPLLAFQEGPGPVSFRTLRISIHVFQDDSGLGNFRQEVPGEEQFLSDLSGWVNHRLANLDTLRPAMPSAFIPDSRVRIRTDSLFYHRDSKAWDCSVEIPSLYMRERYVDGDSTLDYKQKYQTLPVFIGANNPVTGGHSSNIGERGFIAVRGYYENFLGKPYPEALDECGRNLVHELGHCLGLIHNFTGGPEGDQCDNCDDDGCPLQGTSNNIMDYWPSYGYAMSECQFLQIQAFLRGERGTISETIINDSCYVNSGTVLPVSAGDTLLISDTVYAHSDLLVKAGGVVRVTGYLSMPGESLITVEPGGRLEVDGGTVGNLCGDLWSGIKVPEGTATEPAHISVIHSGTLENARTALSAAGHTDAVMDLAVFRNCEESLVFLPGSADTVKLTGCNFRITTRLNHYEEGITPGEFLHFDGGARLEVADTRFVNEPGTFIFDSGWMGTGISADAGSVRIEQTEFVNLTNGVDLYSGDPESKMEVIDNQFINNRNGVLANFKGIQWIESNRFVLQRFNSGNTLGVHLWKPDRFAILRNRFESVYGSGRQAGIVLSHPSAETSPVFENRFNNLPVGIFADGSPDIDSTLFAWARSGLPAASLRLGPQYRFNRFDTVSLQLAQVTDSVFGTAIGNPPFVGREYSTPATEWDPGGYGWYAGSIPMVAFRGWKTGFPPPAGHGLYWFMNYPGLDASGPFGGTAGGFEELGEYLKKLSAVKDSSAWYFPDDVYLALGRISGIPAALRSAELSGCWEKYGAAGQTWLREALGVLSGRFTRADSLLTRLGTVVAQTNREAWKLTKPAPGAINDSLGIPPMPGFDFPDLATFRFFSPSEAESDLPGFLVYPVPSPDIILVRPRPGFTFETAWNGSILSVDGRPCAKIRIHSWEDGRIDISNLPAGLYFIELFSGNRYLGTAKFIKTTQR
jgi:hypothetical protein